MLFEPSFGREVALRDTRIREDDAERERVLNSGDARFFFVSGPSVAVNGTGVELVFATSAPAGKPVYIGSDKGLHFFAIDVHGRTDGFSELNFADIRFTGMDFSARDIGLALAAVALFEWTHAARFCETCGGDLKSSASGWERVCDNNHVVFPRTDPAVIMAIRDPQDRLLIARNPRWPAGYYSVLAGFCEAGETVEAALRRETAEEIGANVVRCEYRGSQPWPFPRSLMLGYAGWVDDSEIVIGDEEVQDAFYITRADFRERVMSGDVKLPGPASMAYWLMQDWLGSPLEDLYA
ncbi:MAG: NAD(+) diphosphatase [Actinomycetaceae bacterium]|nr:NAD(+) diphosphatase [Actinomycetaceae bacterium]